MQYQITHKKVLAVRPRTRLVVTDTNTPPLRTRISAIISWQSLPFLIPSSPRMTIILYRQNRFNNPLKSVGWSSQTKKLIFYRILYLAIIGSNARATSCLKLKRFQKLSIKVFLPEVIYKNQST